MKSNVTAVIVGLFMALLSTGCALDITPMVNRRLDAAFLNAELETPPLDIGALGACPGTLPVRVTNAETRKEPYIVYDVGGVRWRIVPDQFIDDVVRYAETLMAESGLTVDRGAGKLVSVSLEEAAVTGNLSLEASVTLRFDIPEIGVSRRYRGIEGSGLGDYAMAYGVHLAVVQFMDDPEFQKYITCRKSLPAAALRVRPAPVPPTPKPLAVSLKPSPPSAADDLGEPIPIAIFPWEFTNNSGYNKQMVTNRQTDASLKRAFDGDPRFEVIHTWYDWSSMPVKKDSKSAIDWDGSQRNRVWQKTGGFGTPQPDVENIVSMGRRIGAQAVVLVQTQELSVGISRLTIAIVDVGTGAVTADSTEVYYLNYPGIPEKQTKRQLDAFFLSRTPRP